MKQKNHSYLIVSLLCLILIFTAGCGRKGEPIPIIPPREKAPQAVPEKGKQGEVVPAPAVNKIEPDSTKAAQLLPPTGLSAVFIESSIVLSWDEVMGQGVKVYNIYRSTGGEYSLIGKTGIPAFTDKDIERGKKYYYKVSTVAGTEGRLSKEIEVITKPRE
jgi:predicted small lipoprotein YifL